MRAKRARIFFQITKKASGASVSHFYVRFFGKSLISRAMNWQVFIIKNARKKREQSELEFFSKYKKKASEASVTHLDVRFFFEKSSISVR